MFHCFLKFSTETTWKVMFHLLSNRIFWEQFQKQVITVSSYSKSSVMLIFDGFTHCGFQIPGTEFHSLSGELGFWIPIVSEIPDSLSCILDSEGQDFGFHKKIFPNSGFHGQNFPDSGIPIPLHWVKHWGTFTQKNILTVVLYWNDLKILLFGVLSFFFLLFCFI